MLDDLAAANGTCYMSGAGVDVTDENLDAGLRFSWPTYKTGGLREGAAAGCCAMLREAAAAAQPAAPGSARRPESASQAASQVCAR